MGQQPSQPTVSPQAVTVTTIKNKATVVMGEVESMSVAVMFDSGSAVSLLRKRDMVQIKSVQCLKSDPHVKLITASGDPLSIVDYVKNTVQVDSFKTEHEFVVFESLIYSVILGIDFLQQNELVSSFTTIPVSVCHSGKKLNFTPQIGHMAL